MSDLPPFRLGYRWTIGLETEAGWVREPTGIEFLGDKYWLRAASDTALPDISVAALGPARLNVDVLLIKALARHFIEYELCGQDPTIKPHVRSLAAG